jgi:hypothetical protein
LAPVLWILALLATQVRGRAAFAAALAVAWVLIVGPPPLPDRIDLMIGLACQGLAIGLLLVVLLRSSPFHTRSLIPEKRTSSLPPLTSATKRC